MCVSSLTADVSARPTQMRCLLLVANSGLRDGDFSAVEGVISLPIVTTEAGVFPEGVGVPIGMSLPEFGSIVNTDILSDAELPTNKYLPVGSTFIEPGVSPAVTRGPIKDSAPVV
jgi:hypothetical protein